VGKTKIPWCDFSLNPVKGLCPVDCKDNEGKSYCYARRMYQRFKWNPEIRYEPDWWHPIAKLKQPSRIFVGSTIELFGPWMHSSWLPFIVQMCGMAKGLKEHTFIFLTKRPWELQKYNPWPSNCWVGASATDDDMAFNSLLDLRHDVHAAVRFLSCEPLLGRFSGPTLRNMAVLDWLILGGLTRNGRTVFYPPEEWIQEIEQAADCAGIPIFEKPNLRPQGPYRQEWPLATIKESKSL